MRPKHLTPAAGAKMGAYACRLILSAIMLLSSHILARADDPPAVSVAQGTVTGRQSSGIVSFLGIPYAKAPMGSRRWAPTTAPRDWGDAPKKAVAFGPSCPQTLHDKPTMAWTSEYLTPAEPGISEDCLSLNIWAPSGHPSARERAKYPVLVFILGGGFSEGGSAVPIYDGANLARRGIVTVTLNYRLGTLGFLAHRQLSDEQGGGSGNYGFQDQIAALTWVKNNIANFGGDPAQVALAGQSAGAWSVMALLASPEARGLFRSAIVMSVPDLDEYTPLDQAEARGAKLFSEWNVTGLSEARSLEPSALTGATASGNMTSDRKVLPDNAAPDTLASDVPMLMGYTLNDLFAPSPKFTPFEWRRDAKERYGANADKFLGFYPGRNDDEASESAAREAGDRFEFAPLASWLSRRNAKSPVYVYRFSHVEPGEGSKEYGAFHTSELPYMFDTLHASPARPFTRTDRNVVRQFAGAIEAFVKTNDPNGDAIPYWPAMTAEGKQVMEFADTAHISRIFPSGADDIVLQGKAPPRQSMK